MITLAPFVRSTVLVGAGAAIAFPLAGGTTASVVPVGPFTTATTPATTFETYAADLSELGPARDLRTPLRALARPAATAVVRTSTRTTTPHTAPDPTRTTTAPQGRTPSQPSTPVASPRTSLGSTVQLCPGAPVDTEVRVQPGDLLTLRVRPALRTPAEGTRAAAEAVEVSLPAAAELLQDPASAQVSAQVAPGGSTGATAEVPVVERALAGTAVRVTAPEPSRVQAAVAQDVDTARRQLPRLQVQLGASTSEVSTSTWASTAGAAGGLSFALTDGDGCSTLTWSLSR